MKNGHVTSSQVPLRVGRNIEYVVQLSMIGSATLIGNFVTKITLVQGLEKTILFANCRLYCVFLRVGHQFCCSELITL